MADVQKVPVDIVIKMIGLQVHLEPSSGQHDGGMVIKRLQNVICKRQPSHQTILFQSALESTLFLDYVGYNVPQVNTPSSFACLVQNGAVPKTPFGREVWGL